MAEGDLLEAELRALGTLVVEPPADDLPVRVPAPPRRIPPATVTLGVAASRQRADPRGDHRRGDRRPRANPSAGGPPLISKVGAARRRSDITESRFLGLHHRYT